MKQLDTKYNHKNVETGKYEQWLEARVFEADPKSKKEPFSIVIPPPNVTGKLHLGHAWDTTLQDIIIRMKKLQGFDTFWIAGMDHAGIATQAKVEERLRENGISRYDLGREAFLEKAWEWKDEYANTIKSQWAKLGLSLDYSRERFTLDSGVSKAVSKVFVDLYNKGIIYRGERIINWDPKQKTALSNIEVVHKDIQGAEHYFKYKFVNSDEYLTIMTTRPETMFGDGAVAVHPDDKRYSEYVGKYVIVPGTTTKILVIADEYVDQDFGTGVVKITPAHDPNDFEVGKRHNVPERIIMNLDGSMCESEWVPEEYQNLDRFVARKLFLSNMKEAGLLIDVKPIIHSVGHSERSGVIVEPYLSKQWFVNMKALADNAILAQKSDQGAHFYPDRFESTFMTWMENIQDWCISRQLWWGHQIPAYYNEAGEIYVGDTPPSGYVQDEDVLDTWFSSALWPFSTLNWPDTESELFQRYFPTNVLVTGYDIIFFWVSRMIFQSLEFTNKMPFNDVLIHGLIRAKDGKKMSKSLGNGVDPMDVIETYGADSLRYFLTTNSSPGQDLRYDEEKVTSSWNFINKIWNASRFVMLHVNETTELNFDFLNQELSTVDYWILQQLDEAIFSINKLAERYEFGEIGRILYNFIWDDFCDWYIEFAKVSLWKEDASSSVTKSVLAYTLKQLLTLIHPFMPYVTEEIFEKLAYTKGLLITSSWPKQINIRSEKVNMEVTKQLIKDVRELRLENNISSKVEIEMFIKTFNREAEESIVNNMNYITHFTNAKVIKINESNASEDCLISTSSFYELKIPSSNIVDNETKIKKLQEEHDKIEKEVMRSKSMLANQSFIDKAPKDKVAIEREKLKNYEHQLAIIKENILK